MKQDNQVFFLTLIDFFFQIIFFGIFIYALVMSKPPIPQIDEESAMTDRLREHFGVSNIVELTDTLTRLAPADLTLALELMKREGGLSEVERDLEALRAMKKEKEKSGVGKRHCLLDIDRTGNEIPRILSEVLAFEESITFVKQTRELEVLLQMLTYDFEDIRSLSLNEFKKYFSRVLKVQPDCLYTLRVYEMTRYVEPRDAIRPFFYIQYRKGIPPP